MSGSVTPWTAARQGSVKPCMGSVERRVQSLWHMGSGVGAPGLQSTGLVDMMHGLSCSLVSSWPRD